MISVLEQLYIDGFSEDGVEYARFFCVENFNSAIYYPKVNPVSCAYLIERELNNGTKIGYLSALSTKKENRGLGFASMLVYEILNEANKRNYPFVVLGPFNPVFYKKFSFFDFDKRVKQPIKGGNVVAKLSTKNDINAINSLFTTDKFSCVFNDQYYAKLEREAIVTKSNLYTLYDDNKIVGFCVKGDNFISNIVCKENAIEKCSKFLELEYLAKSNKGLPFLQMRITDVFGFLQMLSPIKDFSYFVKIKDSIVEGNNIVARVYNNENKIEIERTQRYEIELEIKELYEFLLKEKCVEKIVSEFIDNY